MRRLHHLLPVLALLLSLPASRGLAQNSPAPAAPASGYLVPAKTDAGDSTPAKSGAASSTPAKTGDTASAPTSVKTGKDATAPAKTGKTYAVADFSGADTELGKFISEALVTDLAQSKTMRFVERDALKEALNELKLQESGLADPDKMQQLGNLVSADGLIVGSYFENGRQIYINARALDIATGTLFPGSAANVGGDRSNLLDLVARLAHLLHKNLDGTDLVIAGETARRLSQEAAQYPQPGYDYAPHRADDSNGDYYLVNPPDTASVDPSPPPVFFDGSAPVTLGVAPAYLGRTYFNAYVPASSLPSRAPQVVAPAPQSPIGMTGSNHSSPVRPYNYYRTPPMRSYGYRVTLPARYGATRVYRATPHFRAYGGGGRHFSGGARGRR